MIETFTVYLSDAEPKQMTVDEIFVHLADKICSALDDQFVIFDKDGVKYGAKFELHNMRLVEIEEQLQ